MRRSHTGNACISKTLWLRPLAAAKCNNKAVLVPRFLFTQMLHNCFILLYSVLVSEHTKAIFSITTTNPTQDMGRIYWAFLPEYTWQPRKSPL